MLFHFVTVSHLLLTVLCGTLSQMKRTSVLQKRVLDSSLPIHSEVASIGTPVDSHAAPKSSQSPFPNSNDQTDMEISQAHLNNPPVTIPVQLVESGTNTSSGRRKSISSRAASDSEVRLVKLEVGETITLRCRISPGPYLVVWNKIGLDYPLTIGTSRFTPDSRVHVRFRRPDKWRLTISKARLTDSGVYTCTTSSNEERQTTPISVNRMSLDDVGSGHSDVMQDTGRRGDSNGGTTNRKKNSDYYVTVVEPDLTDRFQVDAPATERIRKRNKTITVTGPKIVFYGTSLELVCRASFPNAEAKSNPKISLEWYHRGVRRKPSSTRSGGVHIWERWLDSDLLESRLLIAWASEADAGQWLCLDRSNLRSTTRMPAVDAADKAPERITGMNQINLLPMKTVQRPHQQSMIQYNMNDLAFDRIEVEVVDLPDPTPIITDTTTETTTVLPPRIPRKILPTFSVMNDDPRASRLRSHIRGSSGARASISGQTWLIRSSRGPNRSSQLGYENTSQNVLFGFLSLLFIVHIF